MCQVLGCFQADHRILLLGIQHPLQSDNLLVQVLTFLFLLPDLFPAFPSSDYQGHQSQYQHKNQEPEADIHQREKYSHPGIFAISSSHCTILMKFGVEQHRYRIFGKSHLKQSGDKACYPEQKAKPQKQSPQNKICFPLHNSSS
ncbi:hypothetical protein [uncultured Faecalibaculum sp.]|uniref:hypothetical protein n=1 Tax=uncultured Faecalibaculum sp. TaxID=1729681 RepID=UPI0026371ECD|nr:hypothetical protein [uncultured Faecalibaculum sp.]